MSNPSIPLEAPALVNMTPASKDLFFSTLQQTFEQLPSKDTLAPLRKKAWDRFLEKGLPKKDVELFRYMRLHYLYAREAHFPETPSLSKAQVQPHILAECKHSHLVFLNGIYNASLSDTSFLPAQIDILPLNEAAGTYGTLLTNQWNLALKEDLDPFALLNAAFHQEGVFIYIPPKTECQVPLQLINLLAFDDFSVAHPLILPRIQLFGGKSSNLTLLSTGISKTKIPYCYNALLDFTLDENAHVRYEELLLDIQDSAWHFENIRATLKRNSSFRALSVNNGSFSVRNDFRIRLSGDSSACDLKGIWMLKDNKEMHTHVYMDHQAPGCQSRQLFKGVLCDNSKSSFEGKINVRQEAQKTDAFQLNNNLLLSNEAQASSKPNLEIFADDVKASHGTTIGQLNYDQLFYLQSRGLSPAESKNILVSAFCNEVIDQLSNPTMQQIAKEHFSLRRG